MKLETTHRLSCIFFILKSNFYFFPLFFQESLPTPFGLVRSGVAPDHQDTKNVINQFSEIARNPQVEFFGNVTVGGGNGNGDSKNNLKTTTQSSSSPQSVPNVSLNELRSLYNAVVLAYGAESDRRLGIPGENLKPGVYPAREFVQWYNGHPSAASLQLPDFSTITSVAICGLGNVALDIARVLLQPVDRLALSDAAEHAVAVLRKSAVQDVHLLGRRGPAQAAFTPKELRELLGMEGIKVKIHPQGCLDLNPACAAEVKSNRIKRRVVEVLGKALVEGDKPGERTLHLHFLRSPIKILQTAQGSVAGVRLEHTALQEGTETGAAQKAVGTGITSDLPAQLVLESIGYKSSPIEGAPFNSKLGIIPNQLGQVVAVSSSDDGGSTAAVPVPGLFVCGWLKRGPSGIIGTNLVDAEQTVDTMVRSQDTFPNLSGGDGDGGGGERGASGRQGLAKLLEERCVNVVDFKGWEAIDAEEVRRGKAVGKPREKIVKVEEMLEIAKAVK
jgi:adrenodoxin-NADP+ reductase